MFQSSTPVDVRGGSLVLSKRSIDLKMIEINFLHIIIPFGSLHFCVSL